MKRSLALIGSIHTLLVAWDALFATQCHRTSEVRICRRTSGQRVDTRGQQIQSRNTRFLEL